MGKKKKSVDWNSRVSKASLKRDQIGNSKTSLQRSQTSLRRRIKMENEQLLKTYNPEKILEYNPNLDRHTPQTRIAYAKFKVGTLKKDKEAAKQTGISNNVNQKAGAANQAMATDKKAAPAPGSYRPPSAAPPAKAASPSPRSPSPEPPRATPHTGPHRPITPTGLARPVGPPPPRALSPPPGKIKVPTAFKQADSGGLNQQVSPSHRPRPVIIPASAQEPGVVLKRAPPRQAPKPVPQQAPAVVKLKPVPPPSSKAPPPRGPSPPPASIKAAPAVSIKAAPAPKDIPKTTVTVVTTPAPDKPGDAKPGDGKAAPNVHGGASNAYTRAQAAKPMTVATVGGPVAKIGAGQTKDTSISEGKSIVTGQVRTGWL